MSRLFCVVLIAALSLRAAAGQQLPPADKAVLQAAREKYYKLELQGFMSTTCKVHFDLSTMPVVNTKERETDRKMLEAIEFSLHLDARQPPSVQFALPDGLSEATRQRDAPMADLLKSIVAGFFQTWPSKGLAGPIPPFDSQIKSVSSTDHGYSLMLLVPGAPVRLEMDKNYLVTEISSLGGKIDERPTYAPSPGGLVFASNTVRDDSEQAGSVNVQYEIQTGVVDGLQFPVAVHMRVNENIDVKFALSDCSVVKGKVLEVKAP